jgi:hypothetical protein
VSAGYDVQVKIDITPEEADAIHRRWSTTTPTSTVSTEKKRSIAGWKSCSVSSQGASGTSQGLSDVSMRSRVEPFFTARITDR